jgi:hypothetical protein
MPTVSWGGVKLASIGLWSSENAFFGVMNRASSAGSLTDESGFCIMAIVKLSGGGIMVWVYF